MRRAAAAIVMSVALAVACGGEEPEQADTEQEPARETAVTVTLADFSVRVEPSSVPAGEVMLDVTNAAGMHDLYVLRTDLAAEDLPQDEPGTLTRADPASRQVETIDLLERGPDLKPGVEVGKPNLGAPALEIVGVIEPLEQGQTESLTIDLAAGRYVLLCNLVDFDTDKSGEVITKVGDSHFERGMWADFSVQ